MAKTPSDKLFRLIQSLSPAERRYFKIFIGREAESDKKYVHLFDVVAAAPKFDDELFKKKIYPNEPSDSKKYPELKAYLYDVVLSCLQSFDQNSNSEHRVSHLLKSVAALYKRGLYAECNELLQKAKKIAYRFEQFAQQIEIIRWEKQLAYTRMDVNFLQKKLSQLDEAEALALENWQQEIMLRRSFFQVYADIKREAQPRHDERTARLRSFVSHPLLNIDDDIAIPISYRAQVLQLRTLNLYFYATHDLENFNSTGQKLLQLIENQPHFSKENLSDYIASLSNYILSCGLLKRYEEVRQSLEKLRQLQPLTEDDRRKIHRQYFTAKLVLCIFTGEFEEGYLEMSRHLEELQQFDPPETRSASFYFQYFCICFGCGRFDEALDYLNQWLNLPRSTEREDLQSLARILRLIIHYEMGNWTLLESLLRSTTRFLASKNRFFELEKRFVQFFGKLLRSSSTSKKRIHFLHFLKEIEPISSHPDVETVLQTFNLMAWVASKSSGMSFSEKIKEELGIRAKT